MPGARQPWKQGDTSESCLGGGAIAIASLSPQASMAAEQQTGWPMKRLTLNYRVGPTSQGAPLSAWCADLQSRTPAGGGGPLCADARSTEKEPRQGSPLSAWWVELWRKTSQKGLLTPSYKTLQKKEALCWGMTPAAEAVRVPALLMPPGSPQAKQLHHLHTQPSLGQSCHRPKKMSCVYVDRVTSVVSSSLWPCRGGLPGISVREGFSRREYCSLLANTGYHTKSSIFPAALAANPPEYLVLPDPCDPSSCTASTPEPHRGKPKSSREASGANPSGWHTCRGGKKTTVEAQGQCG